MGKLLHVRKRIECFGLYHINLQRNILPWYPTKVQGHHVQDTANVNVDCISHIMRKIAIKLEAIPLRLEAVAGRLEAIASRLEAIASN